VVCTSATAYSALKKELRHSKPTPGIDTLEATGIPELRNHIRRLAERRPVHSHRTTLHRMVHFLTLFYLYCLHGYTRKIDETGGHEDNMWLLTIMKDLDESIASAIGLILEEIKQQLQRVYDALRDISDHASIDAPSIAANWSKSAKLGGRGLAWNTYLAAMRNDGEFRGNDFNADISDPALRRLELVWHDGFNVCIPCILDRFPQAFATVLDEAHARVETAIDCYRPSRAEPSWVYCKARCAALTMFSWTRSETSRKCSSLTIALCTTSFREKVKARMLSTYRACVAEPGGSGRYIRMKSRVQMEILRLKHTLYLQVLTGMQNVMKTKVDRVRDGLQTTTEARCEHIQVDYRARILGDMIKPISVPERRASHRILKAVEGIPEKVGQVGQVARRCPFEDPAASELDIVKSEGEGENGDDTDDEDEDMDEDDGGYNNDVATDVDLEMDDGSFIDDEMSVDAENDSYMHG
jgi:hypothetical protein